ncbi:MAG: NAD-dependent epimerase/dehydratase family protein [Rhizomicrobium sp.]
MSSITGAAGFIGSATTKELITNGHEVTGLARNDANVETIEKLGAKVHRGDLNDLESLKAGAKDADGVIHCAFITTTSPNSRRTARSTSAPSKRWAACSKARTSLSSSTSGTGLIAPGVTVTEDMRREASEFVPRVSEQTGLAYAARGVRAMAMRLPQVHGEPGKAGLISYLVEAARQKGVATYVGEGKERWAAAHRTDVALLYRLALKKAPRTESIMPSERKACPCARSSK